MITCLCMHFWKAGVNILSGSLWLETLVWIPVNAFGPKSVKPIKLYLSVGPSVSNRGPAEAIWPRGTPCWISGYWAFQVRTQHSLWTEIVALLLATGGNDSYWTDRSKIKQHWALTCSGLQLARQLDSCGRVVVMEVADSVIGFLCSDVWRGRRQAN